MAQSFFSGCDSARKDWPKPIARFSDRSQHISIRVGQSSLWPHDRAGDFERCSVPARPYTSRRAVSFFRRATSRANAGLFFPQAIGLTQNSERDHAKALGGISGVSRFASHGEQQTMGRFSHAAIF